MKLSELGTGVKGSFLELNLELKEYKRIYVKDVE